MSTPLIDGLTNLSFSEGCFPDMLKFRQVGHLLKKPGESTTNISNFHPITNLNSNGMILEHLAMKQFWRDNNRSSNLWHLQLVYHTLHFTKTDMTKVVSDLLSAVDSGEPSVFSTSVLHSTLWIIIVFYRGRTSCSQSWISFLNRWNHICRTANTASS